MRRLLAGHGLAAAVAAALLGACALPTDDAARVVEEPDFWSDGTTTTTEAVPEESVRFELVLYWITEGEGGITALVSASRPREAAPTIDEALAALVEGPLEATQAVYPTARTALSAELGLVVASGPSEDGVLTLQVARSALLPEEEGLTAAQGQQLVCTLTEDSLTLGTVRRVIVVDDQGVEVKPRDINLVVLEGGATRENYNDCAAPPLEEEGDDGTDDGDA